MDMTQESCRRFVEQLASSAPAPGGGGAAALVGAIGAALGHMVGSLTVGKKKYAAVQEQILALNGQFAQLEQQFLDQVEGDEKGFQPLAAAYSLPKDTPDYDRIMDEAKVSACEAPLKILELCAQALACIAFVAENGSRLAVSDAGCGAVCCKAAMQAASLTVYINTGTMKDRELAEKINTRVRSLLEACALADRIYLDICGRFGQ